MSPLLSVFIPAYNAANTVREAVASVLDNGCADFELVVVDDGSTDDTARVLESIRHPALQVVRHSSNAGIGATRRDSVALLRGRYMALLDADDIAVKGRFERQLARLEAADGPDILGGGIENFGDISNEMIFPQSDAAIRAGLLFHDLPIANPTVCMKLAPLRDGTLAYAQCKGAEDYALWADAMFAGLRFENLQSVVTRMRRHATSLTRGGNAEIAAQARAVRARIAARFFPAMDAAAQHALVDALSVNIGGGRRWVDGACALAHAAELAGGIAGVDAPTLRELLVQNFLRMLRHAVSQDLIDNDTLELMTETNAHFERWRMAAGGALDREIMALLAAGE